MTPNHDVLERAARQFWARTGLPDSFPRPMEVAVPRSLPLAVVMMSRVTVRHVGHHLADRGLTGPLPHDDRDMRGCLFAYRGKGIVFVSGADDPAEQRFTIAHDAAHFMTDYLSPRETVVRELGEGVIDVLDGLRLPTSAERATALLRRVRLGPHVHLLHRPACHECGAMGDSLGESPLVQSAEDGADALGLELVAPRQVVFEMVRRFAKDYPCPERQCELLGHYFGLPPYVLSPLVRRLSPQRTPSFLEHAAAKLGKRVWAPPGQGGRHET